jgi:phosphopantothenate-cysteine ligase
LSETKINPLEDQSPEPPPLKKNGAFRKAFFSKVKTKVRVQMTPEEYFESTPAPSDLAATTSKVVQFITQNQLLKKKVVLITSGGTTVPLEKQTVRFLDNFSAGTRGSTSAEYFIEQGYACIFLHRQWSLEPYTRHYTHSKNCFLDLLENTDQNISIKQDHFQEIKIILEKYQNASKHLLKINFNSVQEYLWLLKTITIKMDCLQQDAMFYLAAAVSDFYIPASKMVEHKIQSSGGGLSIEMDSVPKFIKPLVQTWAPNAYTVSFKLETDSDILVSKSKKALETYGHQTVVANMLSTRKFVVWCISKTGEKEIRLTDQEVNENVEIEKYIVSELIGLHSQWIIKMQ